VLWFSLRRAKAKPFSCLCPHGRLSGLRLLFPAASGAESLNARGGTVRPGTAGRVPVNREPGAGNELFAAAWLSEFISQERQEKRARRVRPGPPPGNGWLRTKRVIERLPATVQCAGSRYR